MTNNKYIPTKLELIEKEMRAKGKHYADYQKEETERTKRKWWIKKGGLNGNS